MSNQSLIDPGLKSLTKLSLPMMITVLSNHLMFFCDRAILAHYDWDAMNAAASAGMVCAVFQFAIYGIASMSEVFVGQYNGAKTYNKAGPAAWQFLWFGIFTFILSIPLAFYAGKYLLASAFHHYGLDYFFWIMLFIPFFPMAAAINGFFIGRGKVILVTTITIFINFVNLGLNLILVFGIEGLIPELGVIGAAIATSISEFLAFLIIFTVFLQSKYREKFYTNHFKIDMKLLFESIKVGAPNAISHALEIGAWAALFPIMILFGPAYVSTLTIGQNVFVLAIFMTDGIQKGVIAIASNLIGANKFSYLKKLIHSFIKLQLIAALVLFIPLVIFPELLVSAFISEGNIASVSPETFAQLTFSLKWIWLFFLIDGFVWSLSGILTSAGDTKFIMVVSSTTVWFLGIFPIYFFIDYYHFPPYFMWSISSLYSVTNLIIYIYRYRSGKWKKLILRKGL